MKRGAAERLDAGSRRDEEAVVATALACSGDTAPSDAGRADATTDLGDSTLACRSLEAARGWKRSSATRMASRRSRSLRTKVAPSAFSPSTPTTWVSCTATDLTRRSTAVRVTPKSAATES